jgi:lysophospholipase L1-like esterase
MSFAALGDSFTEGMQDVLRPDGRHRGWADRVAQSLADDEPGSRFRYANLAVRGRLLPQVISEQVPAALTLEPDLVTLGAGVNDAMRRHFDLDALATALEAGVRELRRGGTDVVLFAFGDPSRRSLTLGPIRDRIRTLNTAVHAIADHHGCRVVDFWGAAVFDSDELWDADRLHLSPMGHERAALAVREALGRGDATWRTPLVGAARPGAIARAAGHARWTREHAGPWIARRLRGESSGDEVTPKDPSWVHIHSGGQVSTGR